MASERATERMHSSRPQGRLRQTAFRVVVFACVPALAIVLAMAAGAGSKPARGQAASPQANPASNPQNSNARNSNTAPNQTAPNDTSANKAAPDAAPASQPNSQPSSQPGTEPVPGDPDATMLADPDAPAAIAPSNPGTPAPGAPAQGASTQGASAQGASGQGAQAQGASGGPAPASLADNPAAAASTAVAATPAVPALPLTPAEQRKQDVASECADLLKLATDLKADVDKSSKDELSIAVVRKAGEIEQHARKLRTDPRLTAGKD